MKQGRLTIGVIGSEAPGIAVAQALQEAGHLVVALSALDYDTEEKIEVLLPTAKILSAPEVIAQADLILLAVPDAEIETTVSGLAEGNHWRGGQLVIQLAAKYSHEILLPATMLGAIPLALNPAMSFTGTSLDLARIKECYFGISAPTVALPIAQALVMEMGAEPIVLSEHQRESYAEAIAVASNFSAMIVNQAIGLLEQAGVSNPASVIAPVVRSAVDQALSKGHRRIDPEDLIGDS
jgi:predicted short-subunit dehydrogenase-like oxidoreductase (DUF2520 family)